MSQKGEINARRCRVRGYKNDSSNLLKNGAFRTSLIPLDVMFKSIELIPLWHGSHQG